MQQIPKDSVQKFYHLTLMLLGIGFLYLIWQYISDIILLIVFAFLFTTILLPAVDWLEGKLRSRGLAVLVTVVSLIAGFVIFLSSFGMQLSNEAMVTYHKFEKEELITVIDNLRSNFTAILPEFAKEILESSSDETSSADKISGYVKTVLGSLSQLTSAIGSFLFFATMILIFTIIILYEYHNFKRSLVSFIPNKYFELGLRLIRNIEKQVSSYLHGQLLAASSVAILSIFGLWLLNVFMDANLSLIIFIGIIAGLANLIPLIGPFVGMVPAVLVAVMNNIDTGAVSHHLFNVTPIPSPFFIFDIIFVFLIVQQIDNNLVTPKLIGQSVGIHPILVIIALLIGANLMGAIGMLMAVPAAGTIKAVSKEIMWAVRNTHLL
ncbi:MAG: AI-2E family transporter [Candidatus Marinimicrobia bacterium]|nr:AI-2E family transporter [Candidatus Neomarinimicrobiota bacterium]